MKTILIVDDNENNRAVLNDALSSEEYKLVEAVDGGAALAALASAPADLVLLDIMMPTLDGLSTLKRLKSNEKTAQIPVMMVTALKEDTQLAACLDAGAVDYITKPFSNMVVRARVRAVLRSASQNAQNPSHNKRGKIIGLIGAKGGVGTTSTALNVALGLAQRGKVTIGAELRSSFGTWAEQLGMAPQMGLAELLEDENCDIGAQLGNHLLTHPTGLRVLFGPQKACEQKEIAPHQAEALLTSFARMADYTVLDLGCQPTALTQLAVGRCSMVLLVAEPEPTAIASANVMIDLLRSWCLNANTVNTVLVKRSQISLPLNLDIVRKQIACRILHAVPSDPDGFLYAAKTGNPLVLAQPHGIAAVSFRDLVKQIVRREEPGTSLKDDAENAVDFVIAAVEADDRAAATTTRAKVTV